MRDRTERAQRIVTAARELAEAEGWDAVTTRRLAALIEYSQPVLYSHFPGGKDAIMAAAALEGFAELAAVLAGARDSGLAGIAGAYIEFAAAKPALYDAMFTLASELPFAQDDTPEVMKANFAELLAVIEPVAGRHDAGVLTEVFWSTLHGLVTLDRGRRLSPAHRDERLALVVARFGTRGD
ncbi:TetR family transcriptional regulator [Amycolatopsis mediterranei S699]|uniref:TetR family transcriptional regulator n=2 Tax=Amycolatopsis mediterranei TaxID=33910 RepID=A0A0H3DAU0_AMYMU|nr:TetR/AcrR family transcriptional regulator [Amycolatopsis mediterranei]ADJ47741.1 TetR family transcriptional regulator [Amycolatopsis mediterranei U32]AEK44629.1 TetR family transcriptional regulator [Amycolatopsis mediterranei S699]AFO79452.1 TetR family transcriptional regulator [Amycolatopsis mediterranei S699]AGT86580.1 TetR family transcriptional regulator [Amycolatopsis mediterranei RB]KDO11795.1 TetR family transcriptional regulator [Amycolatopsis mediterranei]